MIKLTEEEKEAILLNSWNKTKGQVCMDLKDYKVIEFDRRLGELTFELTPKGKEIRDQLLKEVEK